MEPISLVMLAFNEVDVIENTIRSYHREVVSKIPGSEFVIAEDGSTDGTKELLQKLKKKYSLRIVSGTERKGYTRAMFDGLKLARNDIIFFSDSDGQHDPKDFWVLYQYIKDYDIVSGCKSHRKDGSLRFAVSFFMNGYLSSLFGQRLKDANSGFKLIRKKVIKKIQKEPFKMSLASAELIARALKNGFKVKEVLVQHFERKYGASRGIPTKRIPGLMFKTAYMLGKIRFESQKKY